MDDLQFFDTTIASLGPCRFNTPFTVPVYRTDDKRIAVEVSKEWCESYARGEVQPFFLELAGPREKLFFDPRQTRCAVVTCGGLSPGLNDVIRAVVMSLWHQYGCTDIIGIPYGYEGLTARHGHKPVTLTPELVENIHEHGGSILGSSRGAQDIGEMVDYVEANGIDILFPIGGDGTLRAAHLIAEEIGRRGIKRAVVGIPKTIDNDILHVAKSFGFETAFSAATQAIRCAHVEARDARNGVGLVKLMGRSSGFIAANATLASRDVNYCLIPEVDFDLEGDQGLLSELRRRLAKRGHAVIVVAEGAGQKFFRGMDLGTDKSGNKRQGDIGTYLRDEICRYFAGLGEEVPVKYIDPSYQVRSVPCIPNDSVYCGFLGQMAVHAGLAGKTDLIVGSWNNMITHVPIEAAIQRRKNVDPARTLWQSVLQTTGQPSLRN